jgi:hypothetical protein
MFVSGKPKHQESNVYGIVHSETDEMTLIHEYDIVRKEPLYYDGDETAPVMRYVPKHTVSPLRRDMREAAHSLEDMCTGCGLPPRYELTRKNNSFIAKKIPETRTRSYMGVEF